MALLHRSHVSVRNRWRTFISSGIVALWSEGKLVLHDLTASELERMITLMAKYHDTPMDLADASLVAVAESLHLKDIFSFDSDFYIYRLANGSVLNILH